MTDIRWSHSALKDYEGCARRYHEVKVLRKYPFQETDATRYGTQVHEAIEFYIRDGKPLPPSYAQFQPVVDALLQKPGRKFAEYEMALTKDLKVCNWHAPNAWVRGIADILIIDDDNLTAWVGDWKTGNNRYPDRDQLVLMSLMVFQHFPHIRKVNSALLFIVKEDMVKLQMQRDQAEAAWWKYRERIARLEDSHATGVWNPSQSPLCKWCQVSGCEFNPKH
jgi:PD-(D/E)XK nuclease superfamily